MDEDVFDEDALEMSIIEKDWNKMKEARIKSSFAAGSVAGQDESMLQGFQRGLQQGFASAFLLAKLRGILKALMAYRASYEGHPITDDVTIDAQELLDDIAQLETDSVVDDFLKLNLNSKTNVKTDDSDVAYFATLSMEIDEEKMIPQDETNVQKPSTEKSHVGSANFPQSVDHASCKADEVTWSVDAVNQLILTCPEVADVTRRCKHILKRLRWTDIMIDRLF